MNQIYYYYNEKKVRVMGMSGYYYALDDQLVQKIAAGEVALEDLNLSDYPELDIDKSWQLIYYLLCKDIADGDPPLGYVVPMTADQNVDFGDFGAFYLRAEQVAEALQAITELDEPKLRAQYDFPAMAEDQIYPIFSPEDEDEEELFGYILENFNEIRRFYGQAAADGKGVVFCIL